MTALDTIGVAWAALATGFTAVTLRRLAAAAGRPVPSRRDAPPILLLRPADALTAVERRNLATPIRYPGPLEQIVVTPCRPLLPARVRWLRSDPAVPNRKVGHLVAALRAAPPGDRIVVSIDADVRVDARMLAALAAAVRDGAALAAAAPRPLRARGVAARMVRALLVHGHLSFVALDVMRAGAPGVCGKAMALGPAALAMLPALGDVVGEDLELAARLHAAGEGIRLVGPPARVPQAAPVREPVARFTRWMQVLAAHRPALVPAIPLLFAPTIPLGVLAAATASPRLALAILALVVVRTRLARRLCRRDALAWPLGEALLLAAWLRAIGARTVRWRGRRFVVRRGGRLEEAA